MRTTRALHSKVYRYSPVHQQNQRDPILAILAMETLCDALPTGAMVLDPRCRVIFSNREALRLVQRWDSHRVAAKISRRRLHLPMPAEIVAACERLKHGNVQEGGRPRFGGRLLVRHPRAQNLTAVVALERCLRDRRVAVFCILLQDRLRESLVSGRREQLAMLSMAERGVAKLVADGHRNDEIARILGKSITTVKTQLSAVFSKLEIRTRTQLAAMLRGG